MCIAISSKEGVVVPHKYLEESWKYNDDGAGFMYAEKGKLHIQKGFMTFDQFMTAYEPHEDKACVMHFRITTHGDTNQENTHPFQIGETLGFVHNGVISNVDCSSDKSLSDTNHFNTQYLQKLYTTNKDFIFDPIYSSLISKFIGGSKLVFLNNTGKSKILNESYGKWDDGVWYSNNSYKPIQAIVQPSRPAQTIDTRKPVHAVFKQGSDVYVKHPRLRGKGTIQYFTGNAMVGVLMQGDKQISLLPMSCLHEYKPHQIKQHSFKPNDYVKLKKDSFENVGVVRSTNNHTAWVQWLDDRLIPIGQAVQISANSLDYWN